MTRRILNPGVTRYDLLVYLIALGNVQIRHVVKIESDATVMTNVRNRRCCGTSVSRKTARTYPDTLTNFEAVEHRPLVRGLFVAESMPVRRTI